MAHETIYGFQETNKRSGWKTYHANTALGYYKICGKEHRFGNVTYLKISVNKKDRDCFCCLEEGHKWLFEKAQENITQCQPGKIIRGESSTSIKNIPHRKTETTECIIYGNRISKAKDVFHCGQCQSLVKMGVKV